MYSDQNCFEKNCLKEKRVFKKEGFPKIGKNRWNVELKIKIPIVFIIASNR